MCCECLQCLNLILEYYPEISDKLWNGCWRKLTSPDRSFDQSAPLLRIAASLVENQKDQVVDQQNLRLLLSFLRQDADEEAFLSCVQILNIKHK